MGLGPSEVRHLTLPQYLVLSDAYAEAYTPPDKRRPPPPPSSVVESLKAFDAANR